MVLLLKWLFIKCTKNWFYHNNNEKDPLTHEAEMAWHTRGFSAGTLKRNPDIWRQVLSGMSQFASPTITSSTTCATSTTTYNTLILLWRQWTSSLRASREAIIIWRSFISSVDILIQTFPTLTSGPIAVWLLTGHWGQWTIPYQL